MRYPVHLERCQHGELNEHSISDGEAGRGIYAYEPSPGMRRYYSSQGENCWLLTLKPGVGMAALNREPHLTRLVEFVRSQVEENARRIPGYVLPKITATNVQRFGRQIEAFVDREYPHAVAYLVPHMGPGIPTGVQAVIRDLSGFEVRALNNPAPAARKPRP